MKKPVNSGKTGIRTSHPYPGPMPAMTNNVEKKIYE
jgi:hypothetical protein